MGNVGKNHSWFAIDYSVSFPSWSLPSQEIFVKPLYCIPVIPCLLNNQPATMYPSELVGSHGVEKTRQLLWFRELNRLQKPPVQPVQPWPWGRLMAPQKRQLLEAVLPQTFSFQLVIELNNDNDSYPSKTANYHGENPAANSKLLGWESDFGT